MAATKKSAKRSAAKKQATPQRPSSKKQPAGKAPSARRGKKSAPKTTGLKRRARKGLKAAQDGLGSVLQVGKKTWKKLKITTAKVMG